MGTERLTEEELAHLDTVNTSPRSALATPAQIRALVAEVRASRAEPTDSQIDAAMEAFYSVPVSAATPSGEGLREHMAAALVAAREATEGQ